MQENLLVRGNSKLDKSILCWSLAPIVSCLNCAQCKDTCYARKAYRQYPNVKTAWDRNFSMAKDGSFVPAIVRQLQKARSCNVVRLHVSGDFFSKEYISNWETIIKQFPAVTFYTYTKVSHIFPEELARLSSLPNMNIVHSIAEDGRLNYGKEDRISELEKMGYVACPVTKTNKIVCGKDCKICLTESKVCFHIH